MRIPPTGENHHFTNKGTNLLLLALLLIDGILILIHILCGLHIYMNAIQDYSRYHPFFITSESSYAEFYQYGKYILVILFLIYLIGVKRKFVYLFFCLLFVLFLVDDSQSLHEQAGAWIADTNNWGVIHGIPPKSLGELIYVSVVGGLFFVVGFFIYRYSGTNFRRIGLNIAILLGLFAFFGVVFDLVHSMVGTNQILGFVFGLIEDGGEMVILSLMVWYFGFLALREREEVGYLYTTLFALFNTNEGNLHLMKSDQD